jgi:hypothetical protein
MRLPLKPHPDSQGAAVRSIEVEVSRPEPAALRLRYLVNGDVSQLRLPERAPPARADRLWDTTCFELFLKRAGEEAYREFNFSPSTRWAAYSFASYREGMQEALVETAPEILLRSSDHGFTLEAKLSHPADKPWRISLSAILEEAGGEKSYWAVRHPPGKPDFHHPDCFAAELGPPAQPL